MLLVMSLAKTEALAGSAVFTSWDISLTRPSCIKFCRICSPTKCLQHLISNYRSTGRISPIELSFFCSPFHKNVGENLKTHFSFVEGGKF